MHIRTTMGMILGAALLASAGSAQTRLHILPANIILKGNRATQRLLVEAEVGGKWVEERTAKATFSVMPAQVVSVDKQGTLHALQDGTATLSAKVGNQVVTTKVVVTGTQKPFQWSFRNHILPILTKSACNSGACHGAAAGKGGLKLTLRGYDPDADYMVLTRQAGGRRAVAGEPDQSLLLLKPTMEIAHGGGKRIDKASPDYALLSEWIKEGLPRPRSTDSLPTALEVFPDSVRLAQGATQQILVRARYSDGHAEDVTRWVKFGTSDSSVASVDDGGRVKVNGVGETAITIWFSSRVAFARVLQPYPNHSASQQIAMAPRANFIDDLILSRLQALQIPPSQPCSDTVFLRRAYLDTCGVLPPTEEVERFLLDTNPDKRKNLIESLLKRPEYVDYWTYKWSDLLLVSSKKLSGGALTSFSGWIRKSVQENKSWDRFVREILTAQGSTLENGAANFFVLHKEPIELTETTTQAFMGMSLTCARCHNHPLEKWTQRDYYQMANLLSRVRLKNGEREGEILVLATTDGEINHPRLGIPLPPRPLEGKEIALTQEQDRREALVSWLTSGENPYFAKALVNRVWRNFMGRGIVEAEDDLRLTNPPSNPELLDALAKDFVAHGYDVKHLMRTILTSNAYQRASLTSAGNTKEDRYYSRYYVKRLPAEVLLDAVSQVTGISTDFAGYGKGTRALQLPDSQVASYFLTTFGRPERNQTCACERQQEPNIAQALHLSNGDTVNDKLRAMGGAIDAMLDQKMAGEQILRRLYLSALSRLPTQKEQERLLPFLMEGGQDRATRRTVLEDLFWSVLTSKEFLFNH